MRFEYVLAALAGLSGFGGLLVFFVFLIMGSPTTIHLNLGESKMLWFDAALSGIFFLQHSLMVRKGFRRRMERYILNHYQSAVYAIVSGVLLLLVVLFWQKSENVIISLQGPWRWLCQSGIFFSAAIIFWVLSVLNASDPFGVQTIIDHLRGRKTVQTDMVIRGPYRWIRHPAYLASILMIWACPNITLDRLLLNVLWTLWTIIGTYFEERDMISVFGEQYRTYQKQVPRLLPTRFQPFNG